MFRFLHSSDLHIGKRFGNIVDEDLRGRLREARHGAIERLAEQARSNGAAVILLAGDTFDTETPAPTILRQSLAAMAEHSALTWVILPGNHDSLIAEELWSAMRRVVPNNVMLAVDPEAIMLTPSVALLPAPCIARRPGRDLTEWMDSFAVRDGTLRIGLAHGAIQSFSEDGGASDVISPDRAARAGLDYLGLGDWHGQMRVNDRTWYSGSPEPDRFKHRTPGQALIVGLSPGAPPDVTPVPIGGFEWRMLDLELVSGDDAAAMLAEDLPVGAVRRRTLLRITASGRTNIATRLALTASLDAVAPEFAHVELDDRDLLAECESNDLDLIDRAGALRQAADVLLAESNNHQLAASDREIARAALTRLFSYCDRAES